MKFLADMGISLRTVNWLRDRDHDVFHLRDRGLQKLPDDKILNLAHQEKRIILTLYSDWVMKITLKLISVFLKC
jgi:predicted nuclease of predicted toxin-antitoxin system